MVLGVSCSLSLLQQSVYLRTCRKEKHSWISCASGHGRERIFLYHWRIPQLIRHMHMSIFFLIYSKGLVDAVGP